MNDSAVAAALKKYVLDKNAFVVTIVNPQIYESLKSEFDNEGFAVIKKEDAFWWASGNESGDKEDAE